MTGTMMKAASPAVRRYIWRRLLMVEDRYFDQLGFDGFFFNEVNPLNEHSQTVEDFSVLRMVSDTALPLSAFETVAVTQASDETVPSGSDIPHVSRHAISKLDGSPDFRYRNSFWGQTRRCVLRFTGKRSCERTVFVVSESAERYLVSSLSSILWISAHGGIDELFREALSFVELEKQAKVAAVAEEEVVRGQIEELKAREHSLRRCAAEQLGRPAESYLTISISAMPIVIQTELRGIWEWRARLQREVPPETKAVAVSIELMWNNLREYVRVITHQSDGNSSSARANPYFSRSFLQAVSSEKS
jgi:hypothetical protein